MANSYTQVSHAVQVRAEDPKAHSPGQWTQAARPEGAEALSPGQRPGYNANLQGACKGKSFENCLILVKLLPLQGDKLASMITQGAALG